MKVVLSLDDLGFEASEDYETLLQLREKFPKFKVTLFGVPTKISQKRFEELEETKFIQVAMHGWNHNTVEECLKWKDLAAIKNYLCWWEELCERFSCVVKGFKGPGWKLSNEVCKVLNERGWWIAVNKKGLSTYCLERSYYSRQSIKNMIALDKDVLHLCGHLNKDVITSDGLSYYISNLTLLPQYTNFSWISENV